MPNDPAAPMTCVMMISKAKLRLYSQGKIYFLVDLSGVRVLSRYDYIRRTARVFLVQHC